MARGDQEIDEGTGKKEATFMVGGMDDLVPGGKGKADDGLVVEVEDRPKPKADDVDVEVEDTTTRRARRDLEEDARLAYDVGEGDEIEERGGRSRRQRRNRGHKQAVQGRDLVIDQLNAKVDHLTGMINQMGQSQVGITVNTLDTQLGAATQALTLADVEIKKAIAAGDLARYDELKSLRDEAQLRVHQLNGAKQRIYNDLQRGGRPQPVPPNGGGAGPTPQNVNLNQRAQDYTETFMSRFPDFDPSGTDEHTLVMKAVDDSVAAEGYRPDTPMYWRTLEQRLAARGIYPDDSDGGDDDETPSRPVRRANGGRPPVSGGGNNRRGTGTSFRLEPMMRDYLDSEGILHPEGLDDKQKARRSRLITNWREGQRKLARGEI
jgi:DNA-binding transcriptional regulator YhcF (GntR family)